MKNLKLILTGVLGVLLLPGLLVLLPDSVPAGPYLPGPGPDLQYCQAECRRSYGGYEWAAPPLSASEQLGYNRCIVQCNRDFWKEWDKEMDKLLK